MIDPYSLPRVRHWIVGSIRLELALRRRLRRLRATDPWAVAGVVVGLLAFTLHSWLLFAFCVGMLLLATAVALAERRAWEISRIEETDSLSGAEFERWLAQFFDKLGFDVEQTPYARDFGADLIVTWRGIRTAVQAKSGHSNVGVAAVQQIVASKSHYDCERAMVVTNQFFTPAAIVLAESNGVVMRSRTDLASKLAELRH